MTEHPLPAALFALLLVALPVSGADHDTREKVSLPDMMRTHMLANMRDHLMALHDIQEALARGDLDKAGDIAETRIGMSSLVAHNAASRFAMTAKEGDLRASVAALSNITAQCVACHASYRVQ